MNWIRKKTNLKRSIKIINCTQIEPINSDFKSTQNTTWQKPKYELVKRDMFFDNILSNQPSIQLTGLKTPEPVFLELLNNISQTINDTEHEIKVKDVDEYLYSMF